MAARRVAEMADWWESSWVDKKADEKEFRLVGPTVEL